MNLLFKSLYLLGVRRGLTAGDLFSDLKSFLLLELTTGEVTKGGEVLKAPAMVLGRGNKAPKLPNCMYDNPKYVFDFKSYFWEYTKEFLTKAKDTAALKAVEAYLEATYDFQAWLEGKETWVVLTLGGKPLCSRPKVLAAFESQKLVDDAPAGEEGVCLITGETGPLARLHPSVKFGSDGRGEATKLVSVNEGAMTHFGTSQGYNYPISTKAARYYGSALNHQLSHTSAFLTQTCAVVLWPDEGTDHPVIGALKELLGGLYKNEDGGKVVDQWKVLREHLDAEGYLHVACMQKKMGRTVIRNYGRLGIGELCRNVWRFRMDFASRRVSRVLSFRRLIPFSSKSGEPSITEPHMLDAAWSVLSGTQYPLSIFTLMVRNPPNGENNHQARKTLAWLDAIYERNQPTYHERPLMKEIAEEAAPEQEEELEEIADDGDPIEFLKFKDQEEFFTRLNAEINPDIDTTTYLYGQLVAIRYITVLEYHRLRGKHHVPQLLSTVIIGARRAATLLGDGGRYAVYLDGIKKNRSGYSYDIGGWLNERHDALMRRVTNWHPRIPVRLTEVEYAETLRGFYAQMGGYESIRAERKQRNIARKEKKAKAA